MRVLQLERVVNAGRHAAQWVDQNLLANNLTVFGTIVFLLLVSNKVGWMPNTYAVTLGLR